MTRRTPSNPHHWRVDAPQDVQLLVAEEHVRLRAAQPGAVGVGDAGR